MHMQYSSALNPSHLLSDNRKNPNQLTVWDRMPVKPATLVLCSIPDKTTNSAPKPNSPLDFAVAKQQRIELGFGAFRSFEDRAESARNQAMHVTPEAMRLLPLQQAATEWFRSVKKPTVRKQKTVESYELYLKNIRESEIGKLLCSQLHLGHLLEYQKLRKQAVCVSYVNHETNVISQVLRYCDLWEYIGKHFRQLPPPAWHPPKVLTPEEEEKFFIVAASNPDWQVAYWAVSLTNNTSAHGVELRTLQLKHIFIEGQWERNPKIHIPDDTAKNQFRARVVPLNERALRRIKAIVGRAAKHGAHLPEHYVFPIRVSRNAWDVTRPASKSYIRHAFKGMREATGLEWLQPRYFRNQILTKLFENGTPDETIMAIAGHTSINMSRYYSQIRMDAKKDALAALVPKKKAVQNVS